MKFLRVPLILGVILSLGCAKDRDSEDYKREVAERDAAAYNAVNGHYTGYVKSPEGRVIGAIAIDLDTRFKTTTTTDGSASIGTPTLGLEVTVENTRVMSAAADDGSYNPKSGRYEAVIQLDIHPNGDVTKPTSKQPVTVVASVNGGTITGSMQALAFRDYGNTFVASMGNKDIDQLTDDAHLRDTGPTEEALQVTSFTGTTLFTLAGNVSKPVKVVVLEPRLGGDDDFYDLLVPRKFVTVSFNYDSSAHIVSNNTIWDKRIGLITGQVPVKIASSATSSTGGFAANPGPTATSYVTFTCHTKIVNATNGSLDCLHLTSQSGQNVAHTRGTLQAAQGQDPVDDTSTAAAVDAAYNGKANGSGFHNSDVQLYVSYAARSRLQDIYDLYAPNAQKGVQVTYMYGETLSIGFTIGLWDQSTGTLDATTEPLLTPPGQGHPLWLPEFHCRNFFFWNQHGRPFDCTYKSNRSTGITVKFKSR